MEPNPNTIHLFGIRLHKLTRQQLLSNIVSLGAAGKSIIAYANIKTVNLAYEEPWYANFLNRANLVYCDGFGVILGAKLAGLSLNGVHRATCPDWLETLAGECEQGGRSLFLLAGSGETAAQAQKQLSETFPSLKLRVHHGYFEKIGPENDRVIEIVNDFQPDILCVGFGTPLQERWIEANFQRVNTHVFLPVGACVDYYTGLRSRGPTWLTDNGFEWLCRLFTEPQRLWRRYVVGIPLFMLRVLRLRLSLKKQPQPLPKQTHVETRASSYAEQDN